MTGPLDSSPGATPRPAPGEALAHRMAESARLLTLGRPGDREAIEAAQLVQAAAGRLLRRSSLGRDRQ